MTVEIIQNFEGCTGQNLAKVLPTMKKLGFERIVVHREVEKLVDNSIYIFCDPVSNVCSFPTEEAVEHRIRIPFELAAIQCEYSKLPKNPTGVIELGSFDGSLVGYYNSKNNILYISDITHLTGDKGSRPMNLICEIISQFKRLETDKFVEWSKGFEEEMQYEAILLGADPEFELADESGSIISADTVVHDGVGANKKIGHDGHSRTGEIRPDPQDDPIKLTREFKKLLYQISQHENFLPDGKMFVGGGTTQRTGGHIHVSGIDPSGELIGYLNAYMAVPMDRSQGGVRKGSGNANWEERDRVRSSGKHWEYRPLMAYHFDEDTTNAVHCTFFCVLETFRRDRNSLAKKPKANDYKKLVFYEKYQEHIDRFVRTFIEGVVHMEGIDVLDRWFQDRPKDKKIRWVYPFGEPPKGLDTLLDILRRHDFGDIRKSLRINIHVSDRPMLMFTGVSRRAGDKLRREMDKRYHDASSSQQIAQDRYNNRTWHVVFAIPQSFISKTARCEETARLLIEAVETTLGAGREEEEE